MNPRDVSFNAHEQLEILAEIIKSSNIHPDVLVHFIRQNGIIPDWGNVALPRGRTVNQCNNWFYSIISQPGPSAGPASGHNRSQSLQGPVPASSLKRPFSPDQPSFAGGRLLVPKPPMSTIGNVLNQQVEPPKKKRGRPTNAEKAARSQQELSHGQPLQPSIRAPPPLTSSSSSGAIASGPLSIAAQAAQAAMAPLVRDRPASAGDSETSSGRQKRGLPSSIDRGTRPLQQEYGELLRPSHPGPSRYPNILSPDEDPGEGSSRRQEGSPRGDPATYR